MNKNTIKNITIALLIAITIFSMFRYVSELKERFRLQDNLIQAQSQIAVLAQEKQNLLQDLEKEKVAKEQLIAKNASLKDYLRAGKNRLMRLFRDNAKAQADLEDTNSKFAILKAENRALIENRKRIYAENEQFKLKLSSIVELKKAIKELKSRKHKNPSLEIEGNRGFLIKDGQTTALEKIRIEVIPAQTKE